MIKRKEIISGLDQTKNPKAGDIAGHLCPLCGEIVYFIYDIWEDDRETRIINIGNQRRRWCCKMNLSCRWASDVEP